MRDFKVGDWVCASDWCYGEIIEIDQDNKIAYVSFATWGGGGCLSFGLDELMFDHE